MSGASHNRRAKLLDLAPAASAAGLDLDRAARVAGYKPKELDAELIADPSLIAELEAATDRAALDGSTLKAESLALIRKGLKRLDEAIEADRLDPTEIADLLPKLHRLVEHADKIAAEKSAGKALPVVQINFTGGFMQKVMIEAGIVPAPVELVQEVGDDLVIDAEDAQ